jgi:hypothetical protein
MQGLVPLCAGSPHFARGTTPPCGEAYRLASVRQDSADAASNRVSRRDKHGNAA